MTPDDEICNTCMSCNMVMVVIAERWDAVAAYRNIIEALTTKTMSMIMSQRQKPGIRMMRNQPMMIQEDAMMEDMSQWCTSIADGGMSASVEMMLTGFVGDFPMNSDA
jgi:hypothetical protein